MGAKVPTRYLLCVDRAPTSAATRYVIARPESSRGAGCRLRRAAGRLRLRPSGWVSKSEISRPQAPHCRTLQPATHLVDGLVAARVRRTSKAGLSTREIHRRLST